MLDGIKQTQIDMISLPSIRQSIEYITRHANNEEMGKIPESATIMVLQWTAVDSGGFSCGVAITTLTSTTQRTRGAMHSHFFLFLSL